MKYLVLAISGLLVSCSYEKEHMPRLFSKFVYDLNVSADSLKFNEWTRQNLKGVNFKSEFCTDSIKIDSLLWGRCFYSDENYSVYGGCRGEFGGSLIFIERNDTSHAYYLPSTCPQMVERRNGAFYVTESVAHIDGFGRIVRVHDPKRLFKIRMNSLQLPSQSQKFPSLDQPIFNKLPQHREVLIDTTGVTVDLFFESEGDEYFIYSDYQRTYLGLYDQKVIVVLDTLMEYPSRSWSTRSIGAIDNGIYHYSYMTHEIVIRGKKEIKEIENLGDIYVKNDTIVVGFKYKERLRKM